MSCWSVREGKTGRGWPESSSVEFLAKFDANILALSEEDVKISGPLRRAGIGGLPWFKILLVILQNSREPSVTGFRISKNLMTMVTCSFERLQSFIAPILMIKMEIMVAMGNCTCTLRCKPWLTVGFLLLLFVWNRYVNTSLNPICDRCCHFRRIALK